MASSARRFGRLVPIINSHVSFNPMARSVSFLVPPAEEEATAIEMIKYTKSLKIGEPAYSEAIRILESGASFLSSAKNPSSQMAFGRLELNLATVHANMSNFEAAAEHLKLILNSRSPPLLVKGAALEALAALCVQLHQDQEGMDYATAFAELWGDEYVHAVTSESLQDVKSEAIALRILAEMVNPSESLHAEVLSSADVQNISGAAVLAFAEFHHVVGNFPVAKNLYKKAITSSKQDLESSVISLSAIAMTPEAVHIGAITGLGQLLISVGDFEEAEVQLTEALKDIEKIKGEKHPHVGVILACIGHLYQQRGIARGSNEIFLVEGMYKSALDLMKASPLESDNKGRRMTDIVALTREHYKENAEFLRKGNFYGGKITFCSAIWSMIVSQESFENTNAPSFLSPHPLWSQVLVFFSIQT